MAGMRYQPQGAYRLSSAWLGRIFGGWLAGSAGYIPLGSKAITTTAQFSAISKIIGSPAGLALSASAASDAGAAAFLTINHGVTRNNFTFAGVFRVRATGGVGVGARSDTDNIFLWRNSGNYAVRLNNVTVSGPAMPLNTTLNYVLTSTAEGVFLYVNGALILSMAASVATSIGVGIDVFEDPRGGGAMDMDAPLCFVSTGIPAAEAQALSSNLWQMFAAPVEDEEVPVSTGTRHVLAADEGTVVRAGPGAAITQHHLLATAGAIVLRRGADTQIGQRHKLATDPGIVVRTGTGGTLTQRHQLAVASGTVARDGAGRAVVQWHQLQAAPGTLLRTADQVAINIPSTDQDTRHSLSVEEGAVSRTGAGGAIAQHHKLAASGGACVRTGAAGPVMQRHILLAAAGTCLRSGSAGAVTQRHALRTSSATSMRTGAGGAIRQRHVLKAVEHTIVRLAPPMALVRHVLQSFKHHIYLLPREQRIYQVPREVRMYRDPG